MKVYMAVNKKNGKIYIGITAKSLKSRIKEHLSNDKHLFGRAIRKYGIVTFNIKEIDRAESRQELCEKEKCWIKFYACKSPNGYNMTDGGEGVPGSIPEVRFKISQSKLGDKNSSKRPEVRQKISQTLMGNIPWNKGKPWSDETLVKLSESHKGIKPSEESKRKRSESLKLAYAEGRHKVIRLIGDKNPMAVPEFRAKAAQAMCGLKRSDEHRKHLSESLKGRKPSPESEKKRMDSLIKTLKARHPGWNFRQAVAT